MGLDKLRKEIDEIDKELVALFEKRMKIVTDIAYYKLRNDMEVFDRGRENLLLDKVDGYLENKELSEDLNLFFKNVMDISKNYQRRKIKEGLPEINLKTLNKPLIAYLGIPGSYTHEAMNNYFGENIESKNFDNFESMFVAVEKGEVNLAIIPFENSSTGAIKDNFDLIREKDLYILGEYNLRVDHNLLGIKGANLDTIKEVYSHPQPLEQSSKYLKDKSWKLTPFTSTAMSAKYVSETNDIEKAAIGSASLSKLYNLEILKENINNSPNNYTRFIVVGKKLSVEDNADKISICFSTLHKAGELFGIISEFAQRGINMLNIKSLPILEKPWEYYFYIDLYGNIYDEKVKEALEAVENKTNFYKFLGNYRQGN